MKNYIQPGNNITVAAPGGGVSSGDLVVIGGLIGVASFDALETVDLEIATEGVFELPCATADDIGVGDLLYSDAGELTKVPGTDSKPLVGAAVTAATTGVVLVHCKLGVHGLTGPAA